MKPKLYIETSIVSYLTGRPSSNIVTAGRQQLTRVWWESERIHYDLFISEFVASEAAQGDLDFAQLRMQALVDIPEVEFPADATELARKLLDPGPLPNKATIDAFHIAASVMGTADYLLTWNFKHLANAALRKRIEDVCRSSGYEPPVICTPEELMQL